MPITIVQGQRRLIVATRLNNANPNHAAEVLGAYVMNLSANGYYRYFMIWNPIITGTLNWITVPDSAIQYAIGDGTQTISQGMVTINGNTFYSLQMPGANYADKNASASASDSDSTLTYGFAIDGTADIIALGVESVLNTCSIVGGINVRQLL